ncbi:hypothetical protein [Pedobacter nyackensis]|uniref:hypothetical protein n=1 Tax=Pedobacter nyackensis TaxID=475255 RepID=UPI00292CFA4A|nr:hypothetical protein [Pedobacter nyackensis]
MKKLILLLLCTATLGLVSCKKETLIQENPNRTYNFTIQPNQWVLSNDGFTYTADIPTSVIKPITVDDDGVLVYITHPVSTSSYVQVPYTFDQLAYSYELYDGGFAIDIQSSDFQEAAPEKPTIPILVKLVVIESLYGQ